MPRGFAQEALHQRHALVVVCCRELEHGLGLGEQGLDVFRVTAEPVGGEHEELVRQSVSFVLYAIGTFAGDIPWVVGARMQRRLQRLVARFSRQLVAPWSWMLR